MQARIAQLGDVMRRDICRHPHGNPAGPVGQQIWKGRGHHDRFGQCAVVIVTKIYGVLVQTFQQRLSHCCHARFCISRCRRVIPVDIAKVPLPVHQRISDIEILCQSRHRIVNRGVPMRVIVTHHIAGNLSGLTESPSRAETQFAHRKQNPSMHRF